MSFKGFVEHDVPVSNDVSIHVYIAGTGPPILLLHGHPQTHLTWDKVAAALVTHGWTVIAPDNRGCGKSSKPPGGPLAGDPNHEVYSKRTMAADYIALMKHFGHSKFPVLAHDRGARITHRMALDYPDAVERIMLLDIVPTLKQYHGSHPFEFGKTYYHWYMLVQAQPIPENFILARPANYLAFAMPFDHDQVPGQALIKNPGHFNSDHLSAYLEEYTDAAIVHAACEDYRAGASIDLKHDQESIDKGQKIRCPIHVLWGGAGAVGQLFNVIQDWQDVSELKVTGEPIEGVGHFISEEAPEIVMEQAKVFFKQ